MTSGVTYHLKCIVCGQMFHYISFDGKDPRPICSGCDNPMDALRRAAREEEKRRWKKD